MATQWTGRFDEIVTRNTPAAPVVADLRARFGDERVGGIFEGLAGLARVLRPIQERIAAQSAAAQAVAQAAAQSAEQMAAQLEAEQAQVHDRNTTT